MQRTPRKIKDDLTCIRTSLTTIITKTNQLERDIENALSVNRKTLIQKNEAAVETIKCDLMNLVNKLRLNTGDTCKKCNIKF